MVPSAGCPTSCPSLSCRPVSWSTCMSSVVPLHHCRVLHGKELWRSSISPPVNSNKGEIFVLMRNLKCKFKILTWATLATITGIKEKIFLRVSNYVWKRKKKSCQLYLNTQEESDYHGVFSTHVSLDVKFFTFCILESQWWLCPTSSKQAIETIIVYMGDEIWHSTLDSTRVGNILSCLHF